MATLANSTTEFGQKISPALPITVHLGLAVLFTTLYGLLFFLIVWQLLAILYYKHRKLSYQTVFLFACLLWAGLRTTLFSFYFQNAQQSNQLNTFLYWLLFAFPVYLQFVMLSVLVFYFTLVVVKITCPQRPKKYRKHILLTIFGANLMFLTTNVCASILYCENPEASYQQTVTVVRVSLDYMLFLIAAVVLCFSIIKLTQLNTAKVFLEGQGVSFCQAMTICSIISLLYISRAIYNILAVSSIHMPTFGYGWINVSDQGEVELDNGHIKRYTKNYAFLSFSLVLFIWELIPTFITVWLFRVKSPQQVMAMLSHQSDSFHTRSYFFDDPNRYDSDEDLSIPYTPPKFRGNIGGLLDIPVFGTPISDSNRSINDSLNYPSNTTRPGDSPQGHGPYGSRRVTTYGSVPTYGSFVRKNSPGRMAPRGITPPLIVQPPASRLFISEEDEHADMVNDH